MGQSTLTLTATTAADLTTKRYYAAKETSTGLALCATLGERCDGVIGVGNTGAVTLERGPKVRLKAGASFSRGAALTATAAGKFIGASTGHHVAFIAAQAATADGDEVDAYTPLSYPPSLSVESVASVSAAAAIAPTADYVMLSVTGTTAYTLDDGAEGHEITIECIAAASSPIGTVTLNGAQAAYGTEPTAYVFNGVDQKVMLRMTSTGWKFIDGVGVETRTSGALGLPYTTHYLSVTGTVAFTLADGLSIGQRKRIECSVAATSPLGTLTLNDAFASESLTHVFNTAGQVLVLEWTATGWKTIDKKRNGSLTVVVGTDVLTGYDMVETYNLSITGTVSSTTTKKIPDGTVEGEFVWIRCTTAATSPAGSIDITSKLLSGVAATAAAVNATTDYECLRWDGGAWQELVTNSVTLT